MEINDFFHGGIINAVDAKGRVSLPATFRATIDRRARRAALPGGAGDDRIVMIGEHETLPCLQAFDQSYSQVLAARLRERAARVDDDDIDALDDAMAAFGATGPLAYDSAGRMVLPVYLRAAAGIGDTAFFIANGETFQVWNPDRFRAARSDKPRLIRVLDSMLAEREK